MRRKWTLLLGLYRGYIGMMENEMEIAVDGLGRGLKGLECRIGVWA